MSNVLDHEKQQQILALGRLGWSLRRIEAATAVRRETVSGYLRPPASRSGSGWSAEGVAAKTGHHAGGVHRPGPSKPATTGTVSTDPAGHHLPLGARRVRVPASRTAS
jgi:hypothetical protein